MAFQKFYILLQNVSTNKKKLLKRKVFCYATRSLVIHLTVTSNIPPEICESLSEVTAATNDSHESESLI